MVSRREAEASPKPEELLKKLKTAAIDSDNLKPRQEKVFQPS